MAERPARRLIINADDLGMSRAVNDAIFEAMEAGFVTSATVLANGDAVDDAVRGAARFPRCSFGVHLNVTWGRPLSSAPGLAPLLDASGRMRRVIFDLPADRGLAMAVAHEWAAQVEALRGRGLRISHFDSHEHVHTIPALFRSFKSVQRKFQIRRARVSKNLYCREMPAPSRTVLLKKAVWNSAMRWNYRTRTTSWFTDSFSLLRAAREGLPGSGSIEAMLHPGATDDPVMVAEMRDMRAGALDELPVRVERISYHEL